MNRPHPETEFSVEYAGICEAGALALLQLSEQLRDRQLDASVTQDGVG